MLIMEYSRAVGAMITTNLGKAVLLMVRVRHTYLSSILYSVTVTIVGALV